jgi:hypothetical protein
MKLLRRQFLRLAAGAAGSAMTFLLGSCCVLMG